MALYFELLNQDILSIIYSKFDYSSYKKIDDILQINNRLFYKLVLLDKFNKKSFIYDYYDYWKVYIDLLEAKHNGYDVNDYAVMYRFSMKNKSNSNLFALYINEKLIVPSIEIYSSIYRMILNLDLEFDDGKIDVIPLQKIINYFKTFLINSLSEHVATSIYNTFESLLAGLNGYPNPEYNDNLYKLFMDSLDISIPIINNIPDIFIRFSQFIKAGINIDYNYIDAIFERIGENRLEYYYYIGDINMLISIIIKYKIKIDLSDADDIYKIMINKDINDMIILYDYIINNYKLNEDNINILVKATYDYTLNINPQLFAIDFDTTLMVNIFNKLCELKSRV
jgi:hypothetical protein